MGKGIQCTYIEVILSSIIEVKHLSKRFADLQAVDNVSFEVATGSCFGLLGPNGAGKTTTLEIMEGLIQPDSGEILYQGRPIKKQDFQSLGIQFQSTAIQDYLTVRETLEMFSAFYSENMDAEQLIELCQLQDFCEQDHRKLSGGQKQRLLLALALINNPQLIFLDEPTTGLDPHSRRLFWDLINQIKQQGKTIILTTHYMDEAEYLCDHIAVMEQGTIIEEGTPHQLLSRHFKGVLMRLPQNLQPALEQAQIIYRDSGQSCDIYTDDVQQQLQQLMAAGISLEGLSIKTPTLDDLFLKLTGHQLQQQGA